MMAPAEHDGFPFPIREATAIWGGADYTVDPSTVCGPGTRYPVGMTIQQMAQLYWRAKSFKLNVSCGGASNYGVADFSTAFSNFNWDELDTPDEYLEYCQIGVSPEDTPQFYPEHQPDNDVPWMVVVPVYQVFTGEALPEESLPGTGYFYHDGDAGYMTQYAPAWMLRLFEYGAMRIGPAFYPSLELTLVEGADTPNGCGGVQLYSTEAALP